MSVFRAYIIDATTGQEMNHPANGKTWIGTGGNFHDGREFVRGTTEVVTVASHADLRSIHGEQKLTAADFDRPVVVKVWGPDSQDWRYLVPAGTKLSDLDRRRAARCVERSFFQKSGR